MQKTKSKNNKAAFKQGERAARTAALARQVEVELSRTTGEKTNQQTWAEMAYQLIKREIIPSAPADPIVSYGFCKGKRGGKTLGQCWTGVLPDGRTVILIAPCVWTTLLEVLDTLTHEVCHAATPGAGHRGEFKRLALSIGMKGPMTTASAGPELALRLNELAKELPEFPAAGFDPPTKKQSTRLRLWQCACPIKVRIASDEFEALCLKCESRFEQVERREGLNEPVAQTLVQ